MLILRVISIAILFIGTQSLAKTPKSRVCGQTDVVNDSLSVSYVCSGHTIVKTILGHSTFVETQTYTFDVKLDDVKTWLPDPISVFVDSEEGNYTYSGTAKILTNQSELKDELHIAMVDSGIDLEHPLFDNKLFYNSKEQVNGVDDDGNGLIDDLYGISYKALDQSPSNVFEKLRFVRKEERPSSHGTHVASILLNEQDNVKLSTFINPQEESFALRHNEFYAALTTHIQQHNVRLVNMSIGTNFLVNGPPPVVAHNQKVYQHFRDTTTEFFNNNANTLFVIASGNGGAFGNTGYDLDNNPHPTLPASIDVNNSLVVGSVNQGSFLPQEDVLEYLLSDFSNYGVKSVDVLAPGEDVYGAELGGLFARRSGTSFATPLVVNKVLMPLLKIKPEATNRELYQATCYSVDIYDVLNPFPVRCGGVVNPDRAVRIFETAIRLSIPIERATAIVRVSEGMSLLDFSFMTTYWKQNGIWSLENN